MESEQEAFRSPEVCKLTGITFRQCDYWATTGVIQPSLEPAAGSGSRRLYSFRDLVAIAIMATLTKAGIGFEFAWAAAKRFLKEEEPRTLHFVFDGIEITIWVTKIKKDLRKKIEAMRQPEIPSVLGR